MATNHQERWSKVTFLVGFAATIWLLFLVVKPFLLVILLGICGAVILMPINEWLIRKTGGHRTLASICSLLATALLLLAPTAYIGFRLVQEAIPLFQSLAQRLGPGGFSALLEGQVPEVLRPFLAKLPISGIEEKIAQLLDSAAASLTALASGLPAFAANLLTDGTILLVVLYAIFARGPALSDRVVELLPMKPVYTRHLMQTMSQGVRSIFTASFLTALIQGVVGWVGFKIAGIPYAIPLAGLMAFFSFIFSLIPILGTGLVWVPAAIWLLFTGHVIAGIFLFAWGVLVIGTVDNFVKPLFTKGSLQLPPSVVLVTLIGGVVAFGPVGALIGPLIASLAAAFGRLWRDDFLPYVREGKSAPATSRPPAPP